MALDRNARRLTTASEFELLQASRGSELKALSGSGLRARIARARRLRDKQRDLLQRQRLASRRRSGTKHGTRPDSNARTAQKAELFGEALERFEARLEALDAAAADAARNARKNARKNAPAPKGKGPKPGGRAAHGKPPKAGQQALLQKARSPRMKAIHAHQGSRGRRTQARRDARR